MARLVFLGRLEDVAGVPHMDCPLAEPTALADLLVMLPPPLAEARLPQEPRDDLLELFRRQSHGRPPIRVKP